jgi:hypothetical protein
MPYTRKLTVEIGEISPRDAPNCSSHVVTNAPNDSRAPWAARSAAKETPTTTRA